MNKTLVLVPKVYDESMITDLRKKSKEQIETTSEAYSKFFIQLGSWSSWIDYLARGKDYLSQLPLYTKYYCITPNLGRANADIIKKALEDGKKCQYFDGKTFQSIVAVHQVDDDWINGWEISYI